MIMTSVTDWEPVATLSFSEALEQAALLARQALPASLDTRISAAVALVCNGAVLQTDDVQTWTVASATTPDHQYRINGHGCSCEDAFYRAPEGKCKHVLAVLLARKTLRLMEGQPPVAPQDHEGHTREGTDQPTPESSAEAVHGIDPRFIVLIQAKPYVKFSGLLQMAHARGLVALTAEWTYNDTDLSLAHAVATFQDGRRFEESGDATKDNTTKKVAVHFRRVALTRAKARVLRDALGVDLVAVEEMGDEA
jgi:hypothetical protein